MRRLGWISAGVLAGIAASPWITTANGRLVTVLRALMPWAGMTGAPMALLAWRHGHLRAAFVHAVVATTTTAVCRPLVRRPSAPSTRNIDQALAVLHANLLYINHDMPGVARELRPLGADVVTFSEYTPHHATELRTAWLESEYPYRVERPARGASGTALWSRHPITERSTTRTKHHTVVADVHAPGGTVRVIVIHTQSPIVHHGEWLSDLERLAAMPIERPAVMTGDFNAGWWHPEFRALFGSGWRDAHVASGHGLSCSWPTERWHALFNWHPPFVRLDHALISQQLELVDVVDLDVPGSDHRGLIVSVIPTARAAP
jgi:endonuclease/exonuclease/phosphatase (EEP) superfamily protein YafD